MPTLRSMAVLIAPSRVRCRARGLLTSLSVSAVTGAVAAWSLAGTELCSGLGVTWVETGSGAGAGASAGAGRVPGRGLFLVVCADIVTAASAQTMISRRRTAVMQVPPRQRLLRKDEVRVSAFYFSPIRWDARNVDRV